MYLQKVHHCWTFAAQIWKRHLEFSCYTVLHHQMSPYALSSEPQSFRFSSQSKQNKSLIASWASARPSPLLTYSWHEPQGNKRLCISFSIVSLGKHIFLPSIVFPVYAKVLSGWLPELDSDSPSLSHRWPDYLHHPQGGQKTNGRLIVPFYFFKQLGLGPLRTAQYGSTDTSNRCGGAVN